jgi:hypothetical protein
MERVKRLAGNKIELGIEIPTIESRASNIPPDKGNYVCCHKGLTDKDLRRICRNQYGHPGPAIGTTRPAARERPLEAADAGPRAQGEGA